MNRTFLRCLVVRGASLEFSSEMSGCCVKGVEFLTKRVASACSFTAASCLARVEDESHAPCPDTSHDRSLFRTMLGPLKTEYQRYAHVEDHGKSSLDRCSPRFSFSSMSSHTQAGTQRFRV